MKSPYVKHSKRYKMCRLTFWVLIICLVLLLFGCAKNTPASESIANSATESLNALEHTIKPECKTNAVESQINAVKTSIKAIVVACDSEKDIIDQQRIRWMWSFIALFVIVLVHVLRKVIK